MQILERDGKKAVQLSKRYTSSGSEIKRYLSLLIPLFYHRSKEYVKMCENFFSHDCSFKTWNEDEATCQGNVSLQTDIAERCHCMTTLQLSFGTSWFFYDVI